MLAALLSIARTTERGTRGSERAASMRSLSEPGFGHSPARCGPSRAGASRVCGGCVGPEAVGTGTAPSRLRKAPKAPSSSPGSMPWRLTSSSRSTESLRPPAVRAP